MTTSIKPIETKYNGYRFRSRLEARWAVFFDAAGIEYQYEPEGFVLNGDIPYLPDFYLPEFNAYVEIKPNGLDDEAFDEAENKCMFLQAEHSCVVLLCEGDPVDMDVIAYFGMWCEELGFYEDVYEPACFVKDVTWWKPHIYPSGKMGITSRLRDPDKVYIAVGYDDYNNTEQLEHDRLIYKCLITNGSYLEKERKTARHARFEHGETPRIRR